MENGKSVELWKITCMTGTFELNSNLVIICTYNLFIHRYKNIWNNLSLVNFAEDNIWYRWYSGHHNNPIISKICFIFTW